MTDQLYTNTYVIVRLTQLMMCLSVAEFVCNYIWTLHFKQSSFVIVLNEETRRWYDWTGGFSLSEERRTFYKS